MTDPGKPGVWQVIRSVFAAAIGVQSNKNRIQDFQSNSIWPFVIGGIIFTIAFVLGLAYLVSLVS
jgi:hypothetical protein